VGLCANVIAVLVISQLAGNVTDITYHLSKYRRTRRGTFSSAILPPLDSLLFSHISGDRRRSRVQQLVSETPFLGRFRQRAREFRRLSSTNRVGRLIEIWLPRGSGARSRTRNSYATIVSISGAGDFGCVRLPVGSSN
jgi:hypothetical protein